MKFSVSRKYVEARPRTQRRKGVEVRGVSASNQASGGIDRAYVDANFVTLSTDQSVPGVKDFTEGFKVGGALIRYDAELKAYILPANLLVEGGVASFSTPEGFNPPTIMDAVQVDGETIKKENGVLVAVGRTDDGGSGGNGDITDEDVVFCVIDEEDDGSTGTGGGISDEALQEVLQEVLKDYVKTENLPTALPNPKALSFGSKTYKGSRAVTLTASDLGAITSTYKIDFEAGKFEAVSYRPTSRDRTVKVPTSVSHLTGGTLNGDLVVDGDLQADHIASLSTSDERLKKNIRTFSATEILQSMGGVKKYEYTEQEVKRNPANAGTHIGFIYQNVEKSPMADKMCSRRVDGYGALNYLSSDYQALLAAVILEQAEEIRQLKEIIKKIA